MPLTATTTTEADQREWGSASLGTARAPSRIGWMLLLVGVLHLPSLFNPFIIDDYVYLDVASNMTWSGVAEVFSTATLDQTASGVWWTPPGVLPFYRPMTILTYVLDLHIWGLNPIGFHLTNLLMHLLCAFLVWRLGLKLLSSQGLAFAAATLFALHPIHSEAVLWVSGRFDLMVCAAVLGSVIAYLNWRQCTGEGHWWGVLSAIAFAVGLGSKETALILPVFVVIFELMHVGHPGGRRKTSALLVGGMAFGLISLLYLSVRFHLFGGLGSLPPPYGLDVSSPTAFGDMFRNVSQYLLDFVLFIQIDAFYLNDFWSSHARLLMVITALSLVVVFLWWRLAADRRLFWIGTLWTGLFTAPALAAMPGERNAYLASVGIALIWATVFAGVIQRLALDPRRIRRLSRAVVAALVVITAGDQVVMWRVADASSSVYRDLMAALPNPPSNARIYVVNQCPLNVVGFTQAVRLLYGRRDLHACALTVSPQLEGFSSDTVFQTGPSSVRIVRDNGLFFKSFIERFLLFGTPPSALPESASRIDIRLLDKLDTFDDVRELDLALPHPLDDERTFLFEWDNRHVIRLTDFIWRANWPKLVPCRIVRSPNGRARD